MHERGTLASVTADETRPLLQGARLTAFELVELGIEHRIVVDGAGPSVIARGLADAVVVGADRIAANGDVANKIGTYPLALAAARAGIPFVVAAPESTLDPATASRRRHRDRGAVADEVLGVGAVASRPRGRGALNPAFDVTPADLVTAIVTERRVIRPAAGRATVSPPVPPPVGDCCSLEAASRSSPACRRGSATASPSASPRPGRPSCCTAGATAPPPRCSPPSPATGRSS